MSEFRLRPATHADDPFFQRLEFETTWESIARDDQRRLGKEWVRDSLAATHAQLFARPGNQLVIAENAEGERVGVLWFGANRNLVTGDEEAWIYLVAVVPEYRGRGVGRLLMDHAEQLAREGGFAVIGLMVSSHNEGARALYERLHYQTSNVVMRKLL